MDSKWYHETVQGPARVPNCQRLCSVCCRTLALAGAVLAGTALSAQTVQNPELPKYEQLLRNAGASAEAIARFEREWNSVWPEDAEALGRVIASQSPAGLAKLVAQFYQSADDDQYVKGPDYETRPGVPQGTMFTFALDQSATFPGTSRQIRVYVPAEYRADQPACVYVQLDDLFVGAGTVFDNLIANHEIPVLIAIGVRPGLVPSAKPPADPRSNRSAEFDGLNDHLARFLLDEVFTAVERHETPDGRPIRLSRSGNDYAVGGVSTGGIGAFTLAWERPDAFRRVFTAVGTFVGMRGGDGYPVLVRKTEPKPIRIFLQDGSHDELDQFLGEMGDWWVNNQALLSALEFAGYDVQHDFGKGSHNLNHPIAVFPDAMRFLWKEWPKSITAGHSRNVMLSRISEPSESWQPAGVNDPFARKLGPHRRGHQIIDSRGREYRTQTEAGNVWLKQKDGATLLLDSGLKAPTGIALSPDGLWLAVAESLTHWGYSYRVRSDGSLDSKQQFYWFHVLEGAGNSGVTNWIFDREGNLYAATSLGIQVFDGGGVSRAILPMPRGVAATDVAFAGPNNNILYVSTADHKIFRRNMKIPGAVSN